MLTPIHRSVRYKMVAVILATTLAALLVSAVAMLTYQASNYRAFLLSDATTQAEILVRTTTPALQFDDPQAARENLLPLSSRRGIVAAGVFGPHGRPFATYVREGASAVVPSHAAPPGSRFTENSLELFHPINVNDRLLGSIYLRSSYDLAGALADYVVIIGLVMLLSMIVAGVISVRLQRSITDPVLAVTDVARKVMDERDFSLRAKKTTDDEIGVLVDSFNAMLAEVGRMTDTLEATNRALAQESEERRGAETALLAADRHKDEFLATLAHELRNPLAPVVNALRIMELSSDPADAERCRGIMQRQLAQMVRLVDDLLDVSRITRGKLEIHPETIELASVVANAVEIARPAIDAQRHAIEVALPDEPVYLRGDAVRLAQVFSNLLNNAAKFTEAGGHIALKARVSGGRVGVTVTDDGIGMAPETLERVFEMFAQGGEPGSQKTQPGLGVGLGLARRLVEMHGGTITASSAGAGCGTSVVVQLETLAAPTQEAESADGASACNGARHRILLVDDNVDFADSLAVLLEDRGHEIRVANDGASALVAARALAPEIAFLDIGLPDMDGFELAARLRELPEAEQTVLVALSGWGQAEDRERARQAGFTEHLLKPVELEQIQSVLEVLMQGNGC